MNQIIASLKGMYMDYRSRRLVLCNPGDYYYRFCVVSCDILGKAYKSMDTGKGCFCAV